ncbi:interferon a3-like isoform X2 [Perca flavescens]|uniref:interferon a3-like isoform X2 n=1 Tax=Perca flavescens TaxID=8167 RepID=UPI00106E27FE|nr:interferon a3-like isoform X2 [Perca flavescens]
MQHYLIILWHIFQYNDNTNPKSDRVTLHSLYSAGSSLSCRWMTHKFRQHSTNSLELIDTMANNSTNTTEDEVDFPSDLYSQASKKSAEDKLSFTVQILEEMVSLFEEDHSAASWEEKTVDHFLIVVTQQADGLKSCIRGHSHKNKKPHALDTYFNSLSEILKQMGHSAEAWELIREEMKTHLIRAEQLLL